MADYDINHITKLGHLQKLAQKENQKADALAARVDALEKVGAQANKIESIKVNGTAQTIASDKSVNITVPTKTSQLNNDSTFQTSAQVASAISTAISKSGHTTSSSEIQRLKNWPANGMKTYLFIRKNKNDEGDKEFYFLGEIYPTGKFTPIETKADKNAVEIFYRLDVPVRQDIYNFFLSDLG